jgi:hypothetical protein
MRLLSKLGTRHETVSCSRASTRGTRTTAFRTCHAVSPLLRERNNTCLFRFLNFQTHTVHNLIPPSNPATLGIILALAGKS